MADFGSTETSETGLMAIGGSTVGSVDLGGGADAASAGVFFTKPAITVLKVLSSFVASCKSFFDSSNSRSRLFALA